MPRFEVLSAPPSGVKAEALLLPVFEGRVLGPGAQETAKALGLDVARTFSRRDFDGKQGEFIETETLGRTPAATVLFVGVGPADRAGAAAVGEAAMRSAGRVRGFASVASALHQAGGRRGARAAAAAESFVQGLLLGLYRFERYRQRVDPPDRLQSFTLLVPQSELTSVRLALRRGEIVASATNWARELVETPAADATPAALAEACRKMAKAQGLACKIWAKAEMERGGFGGIIGVGQGSSNPPRLVELTYSGGGRRRPIAITGKGITFDSGGLVLKEQDELEWMKSDMAGAATAMAVMKAAAELRLRVNLVAAIPFAENLPGGAALRPGDVVRHRGGTTSEVMDTDCEGRLVVADALAYLAEKKPAAIVDSATLTDAAGLGDSLWAGMGNDRALLDQIVSAGEDAGDPGWPLPLPAAYEKYIESTVADIRNTPDGPPDTTIMAATYLRRFAGDVPWVHIDNGSTAFLERANEVWPKGATGSPTRALIRWLQGRSDVRAR